MKTRFYKILYKNQDVVYVGVTLRPVIERFKEHLISKKLNENYSVIEFDYIEHPEFATLEIFYAERRRVAELEQKYIRDELKKGSRLLNISKGGEWGSSILEKLRKEEFCKKFGSFDSYKEYRKKIGSVQKWLRHWVEGKTKNRTKVWIGHWVSTKGVNRTKLWLNYWVNKNRRNRAKKWLISWVSDRSKNRTKSWLKHWISHRSEKRSKVWFCHWVSSKSSNRTKIWAGSWIRSKSKNRAKAWVKNWILHRSESKTQVWVRSWVTHRSTSKTKMWFHNWILNRK